MDAEIRKLAESIQFLTMRAVNEYGKEVDAIIATHSGDQQRIEHTLDWMLDFCSDEHMLIIFKKLCRYYWSINPQATASYINIYREMWDSEKCNSKPFQKSRRPKRPVRPAVRQCKKKNTPLFQFS
jgi:hypothetical protein